MIKQQYSVSATDSAAHEQHKQNTNTSLLAQAFTCMRRSAPLREPSWYIQQLSMSQPGWPSPMFFPKVSKVCRLPTTERPHPRCPCHSSSYWKGSNQEPQHPAPNLNTLRILSAPHLRLNLAPACTAMAGICMQTAFQAPAQLSSTAAAQKAQCQSFAPCQSLPMSPPATHKNLLLLHS